MPTKFYRVSDIVVHRDWQRLEYDQEYLNGLGESMQDNGLLHAIGVDEVNGIPNLRYGSCRLRAAKDLYDLGGTFTYAGEPVPLGTIPAIPTNGRSELAIRLIEYEENIRRRNLTWQEEAAATAKLRTLREAAAQELGDPSPTTASLAAETKGTSVGRSLDRTRKELILANHLDKPEVKSAKTIDDAWKALKRTEAAEKNAALAATIGTTYSAASHILLNEDSLAWMAAQESSQFDIILTDPPYGMGADEFGDSGGKTAGGHSYTDDSETALLCYTTLAREGFRLTRPDAHLYAFCDIDWFTQLKEIFSEAGWRVFRTPLIWHKPSAFRAPWPTQGPQRKYECLLYAVKGNLTCTGLAPDVITCAPDLNLGHLAQKPVDLYIDLLKRSARPGMRVLDPFGGTGPILPAATSLRCYATVLELDPTSFGIAAKRLQDLTNQQELPL